VTETAITFETSVLTVDGSVQPAMARDCAKIEIAGFTALAPRSMPPAELRHGAAGE
jgi:hypothetical protein